MLPNFGLIRRDDSKTSAETLTPEAWKTYEDAMDKKLAGLIRDKQPAIASTFHGQTRRLRDAATNPDVPAEKQKAAKSMLDNLRTQGQNLLDGDDLKTFKEHVGNLNNASPLPDLHYVVAKRSFVPFLRLR